MAPRENILAEARRLDSLDLLPIPLIEGGKTPAFKGWQERHRNRLEELFGEPRNLGLATGAIVAVDCDTKPMAREFFKEYRGVIRCIQETKRGVHFLFRAEREVRNTQGSTFNGLTYDLRGDGGYIVTAPSIVGDHVYRYAESYELEPKRLEVIPDELIPPPPKIQVASVVPTGAYERALKWLAKRDPAVSGQRGHTQMFKTAVALRRKFGLTGDQLWSALVLYNETCIPPFGEKALRHKWSDCQK